MTKKPTDILTFGPVQLRVTNLERSTAFWHQLLGLTIKNDTDNRVELGTDQQTLIILQAGATQAIQPGYSGLYHPAIHLPSQAQLARMLARIVAQRWPVSPTDHIMSQALYLTDPDGLTVELTYETPWRVSSSSMIDGQPVLIDDQGRQRSMTEALDVDQLMSQLPDQDINQPIDSQATIGHIHLHVGHLDQAKEFYQQLGFVINMDAPAIGMADFHAQGPFPHRLAINTWQGQQAPQAPSHMAGMDYFTIQYNQPTQANTTVADPSGNVIKINPTSSEPSHNGV